MKGPLSKVPSDTKPWPDRPKDDADIDRINAAHAAILTERGRAGALDERDIADELGLRAVDDD